jgi:glucokinase
VNDRIIGVDVGGTKIAAASLKDGALGDRTVVPTEITSTEAFLDQLEELIRAQGEAAGVGIAVPSVVDWETGTARFSVNIPLAGVPLRDELGSRLGIPVFVDNDASCAALAEALDDDGTPLADVLVMFTVGTGVGGGVVLGGQIFRGATGAAPELGHIIISADVAGGAPQPSDRFPQPTSLEAGASGRALDELGRERGFPDGPAVVVAALDGDERAIDALRIVGERLGLGMATTINLFDPDLIVVGGGVSTAGDLLLAPAERVARRFALPGVGSRTEIRLARHGVAAGVRGAALLAAQELAVHQPERSA